MHELTTIDVTSYPVEGLGIKQYKTHPRVGEWIEMGIDGIGTMFEVVMIAHADCGAGSDVYVKKIGVTSQAIKSLCNK